MNESLLKLALGDLSGAKSALGVTSLVALKAYVRSAAAMARAEANFLDSIAANLGADDHREDHVPGPKSLSYSEVKSVWDGVNEQAKRLLGVFAVYGGVLDGGAMPHHLMKALSVDEPRLLNGPLGGISRRVKKLLGDPDATFYSIHPDDGRYVLPTNTFNSLLEVVEHERPQWLRSDSWIETGITTSTESSEGGSDE